MSEQKPSFETAMTRLEEIVRLLERGDAPLEQSLALFEEGTGLLKMCNGMLDNAEQKIMKLSKGEDGRALTVPFEQDENEA